MSPSGAPRCELDVGRFQTVLHSHGRELTQLLRAAVVPAVRLGPEFLPSGDPASLQALAEAERLLAPYFRASGVGLSILDRDFRYLAINPILAAMHGITAAEHLGKSVREVFGDFAEAVEPQIKQVFENLKAVVTAAGAANFGTVVTLIDQFGNPIGNAADVGTLTISPKPVVPFTTAFPVTATNTNSQAWAALDPSVASSYPQTTSAPTQYFSFDTPIGTGAGEQCGRFVYSDLHVSGGPGVAAAGVTADYASGSPYFVPEGCATRALTPQEKALEFMLFDLTSCLVPVGTMPMGLQQPQ